MILISDITSRLGTYLCCTQYISQCRAYCIIMLKSSKDPNGQLKCKSVQKSPPHDFVTNNSELRWLSRQDAPTEHHPLSFDPCWKKKWVVYGVGAKFTNRISFTWSLYYIIRCPNCQICSWFATVNDIFITSLEWVSSSMTRLVM